jgi:hypothetical protein
MAQSIRKEPRGFDAQWADNAAEIERLRSIDHGKARELHDPQRRAQEASRHKPARARRIGFTVIAGGLCVGALVSYLLITLSGIGPPKESSRQADVPTKAVPVDAKREPPRKAGTTRTTLEDRRAEEEKRATDARQRNGSRQPG